MEKNTKEKGKMMMGTGYTISKNGRKLKERCKCKLGKNNSKLQCTRFSEENRAQLFKDFWKMSDGEKDLCKNVNYPRRN